MPRKTRGVSKMGFRLRPVAREFQTPPLDPEIESSETAFGSNMLAGDHPLFPLLNRLLRDGAVLNDAMDLLQYGRNITSTMIKDVRKALDALDATLRELEIAELGLLGV